MKKLMIIALAVMAGAFLNVADAKKKDKKDTKKTEAAAPVVLSSSSDTLSYAAGMMLTDGLVPYLLQTGVDTAYMADFVRGFQAVVQSAGDPKMKAYNAGMEIANRVSQQMVPGMMRELKDGPDTIVEALAYRGFVDALSYDTAHYDVKHASALFKTKFEAAKKAKEEKLYGDNRRAGEQFLAENAKKEGVVVMPSGLQYKVLVKGEGETPKRTDRVKVNYEGRFVDGKVFDASKKHGDKPVEFGANQVIKGWTEALCMMPVGSKWQLYIPYQLAYGERDMGEIRPFSALVFDVELVDIVKPANSKSDAPASQDKAADAKKTTTAKKTVKKTIRKK